MFLLRSLDLWILDKLFERLAAWITRTWTLSNFTLARYIFVVGLAVISAAIVGFVVEQTSKKEWLFGIIMLLETLWALQGAKKAIQLEDRYTKQVSDVLPENLRDGNNQIVLNRLFFLMVTIFAVMPIILMVMLKVPEKHLWLLVRGASFPVILTAYYFLSCTPRLPRREKEQKAVVISGKTALVAS